MNYADILLNSFYWHNFKKHYLKDTCAACKGRRYKGGIRWMELHHLTYERLGRELPEDCVTLCEFCHRKASEAVRNGECTIADVVFYLRKKHLACECQMAFNFDDDRCNQMPDDLKKVA